MRAVVLFAGALLAVCNAFAGDITMSYKPVWSQFWARDNAAMAFRVSMTNVGKDAAGLLRIGTLAYPVELPRGANKSVEVYANSSRYGMLSTTLRLETTQGNLEQEIDTGSTFGNVSSWLGVVTQTPGALTGLRTTQGSRTPVADTYCSPSDTPERSVGYGGLKIVLLSRGSERVSDASVEAMKLYALRGGTIMFCGGASALAMHDQRWESVLPVTPTGTKNIEGSKALSRYTENPLKGTLSVVTGDLRPGAEILLGDPATPLLVKQQVGLGRVVVCMFDPFEDPIRTWTGRTQFFKKVCEFDSQAGSYLENLGGAYANPANWRPLAPEDENDPFNVKLAAPGLVFFVLMLFLVMAIPVNFMILSRLRRKELAWITLPLVSLLFSGAIFATTGGLYSAKAARATSGALMVHDGMGQGLFVGKQQLFFPHAGRFDLGFQNVELATPPERYDSFGLSGQGTPDLIDVGQVVAPALEVPNLAFREFSLVQRLDTPWRIALEGLSSGNGSFDRGSATLKNLSPLDLKKTRLIMNGYFLDLGDIPAGSSKAVKFDSRQKQSAKWSSGVVPPVGSCLALEATTILPVGSAHGKEVEGRGECRLLYTWPVVVGK